MSELISLLVCRSIRFLRSIDTFPLVFPIDHYSSISETLLECVYCSLSFDNNPQGRGKDTLAADWPRVS